MEGKLKIWMQLLLTIGLSLVVVWAGVIVWQGYVSRTSALQQAEEFSLSMHEAAMAGLTGMMVTGTIDRREVLLDQMNQLGTIRDVRVVRGPALTATFGAGTPLDPKPDADEQWVLDKGKTLIKVERDERGEYLRAIRPTLALSNYLGKNCLTCHQVPERSVLGAVSMKVSLDRANEELASQRWKSVLVALLTSIPVLALIYPFIRRVVTRPLETGVQVAHDISRGDLRHNVAVTSGNEIGGLQLALQGMTESLRRMVGQVRSGVDSIYSATSEIASGNQDLSNRTEQQAATLDRVASSMQELTSAVNQNADHARQADRLATAASEVAAKGGAVVANVVDTMQSIQASSQRVADIIAVIDNIAFQTNILALNAAVEAARAGEQGRGFAVVASEVRALAQRSASAAREIKNLIDDSVQKVSEGSALVHQAGATMNDIVTSIGQVTDIIGNIAAASAEQTQGISRLDEAVVDINSVTQQNAALVEQAAAAAQSLKEQAAQLERVMDTFKT